MTKKSNHIHKFRRDRYSTGRAFYYCILDGCSTKIDVKHTLGKSNLCNECGKSFVMNEYSIRAAKPKCMDCVKRRNSNYLGISLDDIGVKVDANLVDRNRTVSGTTSTLDRLRNGLSGLVTKEYNPDDEENDL